MTEPQSDSEHEFQGTPGSFPQLPPTEDSRMPYMTMRDENEAEPSNTTRKDKARDFSAHYPKFQTTDSLTERFTNMRFAGRHSDVFDGTDPPANPTQPEEISDRNQAEAFTDQLIELREKLASTENDLTISEGRYARLTKALIEERAKFRKLQQQNAGLRQDYNNDTGGVPSPRGYYIR